MAETRIATTSAFGPCLRSGQSKRGWRSNAALRSDIGEVIKTIVDDDAFPDYAMPKKNTGRKKKAPAKRSKKA